LKNQFFSVFSNNSPAQIGCTYFLLCISLYFFDFSSARPIEHFTQQAKCSLSSIIVVAVGSLPSSGAFFCGKQNSHLPVLVFFVGVFIFHFIDSFLFFWLISCLFSFKGQASTLKITKASLKRQKPLKLRYQTRCRGRNKNAYSN